MRKYLFAVIAIAVGLVAASSFMLNTKLVDAQTQHSAAVFDSQGRLKLPVGYRKWVYLGAPLTPNGLNGGNAGFPEYHNVYVEEKNLDVEGDGKLTARMERLPYRQELDTGR